MSETKLHTFSYTPKASLMTKTYQPKGSTQAPKVVPNLVSGVRPAKSASSSAGKSDSRK